MSFWLRPSSLRFRRTLLEALVSACLAFIVWLYLHSRVHHVLEHVQVPISLQLAPAHRDAYALEVPAVPKATLSFSGPHSRMRELKRKLFHSQIQVSLLYAIPDEKLKESTFCDVARLEGAHLNVPPGIQVEWADAHLTIPITVHRLAERKLPVRLEHTGDVRLTQIKVEPPSVLVRGPKASLDRAQFVSTLPYNFAPPAEGDAVESQAKDAVGLVTELDGRAVSVTPAQVQFKVTVHPRKRVYEIVDLPVRFSLPDRFPWHARFEGDGKIALRLIGPAGEEAPTVRAYVDLAQGGATRGRNVAPVRIELPKDFELVERRTPTAAFYLEETGVLHHDAARPTPEFELRPPTLPKNR